jgi:hypothetical protein
MAMNGSDGWLVWLFYSNVNILTIDMVNGLNTLTKLFVVKIGLAKAYLKEGLCLSKNTEEETSIFF